MTKSEQNAYSRGYAAGKKKSGVATLTKIDEAQAKEIAQLLHVISITRKRNEQLEHELAQARASRDTHMENYNKVSEWMKKHVGINGSTVIISPDKLLLTETEKAAE